MSRTPVIALPAMGVPATVERDGVRLAVWDRGPRNAPLTFVLLHGFPEIAWSWRHQVEGLAAAGHRVIAFDQRGYGQSDAPQPVEAYDIVALCADVVAVLDACGAERAVVVGHDWGGLVAWQFAERHPGRTLGVAALNTPYTRLAPEDPVAIYRRRFGPGHYIVQFQEPGRVEAVLDADIERAMRYFFRDPRAPGGGMAGLGDFLGDFAATAPGPVVIDEAALEVYARAFSRHGFAGPVNWYRNFTRNWHLSAGLPQRVEAPALMVMAENDPVLPPRASDGMEKYVPDLERVLICDCGHWTQQEKPAETTAALLDWAQRRLSQARSSGPPATETQ